MKDEFEKWLIAQIAEHVSGRAMSMSESIQGAATLRDVLRRYQWIVPAAEMKASDITVPGYYWCTHDLGMWIPDGSNYPEEWHVVQILADEIWQAGADVAVGVAAVPPYVHFVGPLVPPAVD